MSKIVDFNGIGYVAATFPVGSELKTYLEQNHLNARTGNVDVNVFPSPVFISAILP